MSTLIEQLITMENENSLFEEEIRKLPVSVCSVFLDGDKIVPAIFQKTDKILETPDLETIKKEFPKTYKDNENKLLQSIKASVDSTGKKVAVLFSGGPAAGGHNVIVGLKKVLGSGNKLYGVKEGPKGLINGKLFEIKDEDIPRILNTGGFDFLGSDRTKIKTEEQFAAVRNTAKQYELDGIVVVGGDDSNTNAAVLAELLYDSGVQVIGVPKTIDGDLQIGDILPISFGYDTATKVYSELVGNILKDAPSSRRYWHFIRIMGRSASHVGLEVALQTKVPVSIISEEVVARNMGLSEIVKGICDTIAVREAKGMNYGVVIVPEGLIENIPEMTHLITELNDTMAHYDEDIKDIPVFSDKKDFIYKKISANSVKLMASLPDEFEEMLLLDRDPHGNLQVAQVPTEKLILEMVKEKLKEMKKHPREIEHLGFNVEEHKRFIDSKFASNSHYFGYEGRCGAPSLFDAAYTLNLGLAAGSLILDGKTGYMVSVADLDKGGNVIALPLTGLLNVERRHGKNEMVIKKGLVEIESEAFKFFNQRRDLWGREDHITSPGPRQFWGETGKQIPITVALNRGYSSLKFDLGKEVNII